MQGTRATVALPRASYLRLLAHEPMMPLRELLEVTHDSPAYNERERQGVFEIIQHEDLNAAETHLQKALELEPDNDSYLLALAQAQLAKHDLLGARHTLEAACRPSADEKIRAAAHELLDRLNASSR